MELLLSQVYQNWAEEVLLYIKVSYSTSKYSSGISLPTDNQSAKHLMSPTGVPRVSLPILSAFSYLPNDGHRLKIINTIAKGVKYILCAYKLFGPESAQE